MKSPVVRSIVLILVLAGIVGAGWFYVLPSVVPLLDQQAGAPVYHTVKVQKGDTLATLASRHDVTPMNIAAWNKLKIPVALKPGQSIAILVPTTASSRGSQNTGKKSSINQGAKSSTGGSNAKKPNAKSKQPASKTGKPNSPQSSIRN